MHQTKYSSMENSKRKKPLGNAVNSLPNDNILGMSKSKAFADDKIKVTENLKFDL